MEAARTRLHTIVATAVPRLLSLTEEEAAARPYADKWSLKETLGHLIDSAMNNHQRIVRMQATPDLGKFTYDQLHWVRSQRYQEEPWTELVGLWRAVNTHLAHTIGGIHPSALGNVCDMGYPEPATLSFVVEDYLRHAEHHLAQIFSGDDPRHRTRWQVER